jgi:hypothetical protein
VTRRAARMLLLALAALPARAQGQEPPPPTEPADRRVDIDFQRYYPGAELQSALQALAGAYPELLRLESMGRSRGGRELWVVTLAARDGADPASKGAVLLVGGRGADDPHGVEMALFTVVDIALNHKRDLGLATLLAQTTLYVVPCLDPDARARLLEPEQEQTGAPTKVVLDRNFPAGWSPWGGGTGGPYPLCEPETRALVEFLAAHPNIGVVQTYTRQGDEPVPAASPTRAKVDRAPYEAVLARAATVLEEPVHLTAFDELSAPGGSLLAFVVLERGAFGFTSAVAGRGEGRLPQVQELFALARRATQHTLLLAQSLPRLAIGEASVQRLKSDLWQVDLALRNDGLLPTASALAQQRRVLRAPQLEVSGARLEAAALRAPGETLLRPLPPQEGSFALPEVPGGGRIQLRLVVSAAAETTLSIAFSAPRAGVARADVTLQ